MPVYSYSQIEGFWDNAGGPKKDDALMAAIAEAESGGNSDALNPSDNGGTQSSFGLWQISNGTHTPPAPNWNNPNENARLAVAKFNSQGLTAWGTYDSGAYKQYLQGGVPANPGGGAGGSSSSNGGTSASLTSNPLTGCPPFMLDPTGSILCGVRQWIGNGVGILANPVDAAERVGLVVLGALLLLIGVAILGFGPARTILQSSAGVSREARAVGAITGGSRSSGPSPEAVQERQSRMALAERNVSLGERKQQFREDRERRLALNSHRRREPNPSPQHS